jgi:2-amino-4-hydroxy-6-hydroxymethyldihydropteridine diphosphokinase
VATAYLALGSNLGDRAAALHAATDALASTPGISVDARSPVFETDAVADEPQPPYLNAALRVSTRLPPRGLLEACLGIETRLGRVRAAGRKAPRTIDIDLLLYDDIVLLEPGLEVPHPRLGQRPFVRIPLAAVATRGLRHPTSGEALDRAEPDAGVRRYWISDGGGGSGGGGSDG